MKKFHIPIGRWQKYGWKWDTAIGLGTQIVTMGVANFMYAKHIREPCTNETAMGAACVWQEPLYPLPIPFHRISLSFSIHRSSNRFPDPFHTRSLAPYIQRFRQNIYRLIEVQLRKDIPKHRALWNFM